VSRLPKSGYNITGLTTELIQQLARECGFELAGVAPAITAAVHHATGVRVRELPVRIEDLLRSKIVEA